MAQIRSLSILLAFVFGAGTTLWGLSHMSLPMASSAAWDSLYRYSGFLALGAVIVEVCARVIKIGRLMVGMIIAALIALLTGAVWPLMVSICFALASYIVGLGILFALKIDKNRVSILATFLTGAAAYGTVIGLLAHFPINYPGLYGAALAIPIAFGWRSFSNVVCFRRNYLTKVSEFKLLDLAITLIALVHFSVSLMPEVGSDALAMHLFIPGQLFYRHEWGFDASTYVWAVMPMMGDWLYSIGYMLAGETAARIINVGFIFTLSWLVRDLVLWAGGNAVGARWAVLLFLTTPLTFTESSSLFIESIWASFVVAGSLSVFKSINSNSDKSIHLIVAGLLLGGALAAKAVTFTILPALLLVLVFRYRFWFRLNLTRPLILGLILFITVGAIPYITAWILTGNPVFPFFNHVFQSPLYPVVNFDGASFFSKGLTWDIFYQATFHTEKFLESRPGAPGFQWLLLVLPALLALLFSWHRRGVTLFLVAGLSVSLTFQSVTYLRYVFPSFAWVAAGIGVVLSTGMTDSVYIRRLLSIVGWAVVLLNFVFFKAGTCYGDLALQPLMSPTGRESYLNSRLPIRNAVELINRLNVWRTPVAIFSSPLVGATTADVLYPNWYNNQFQTQVNEALSSEEIVKLLQAKGVDYLILDDNWGDVEKRKLIEDATENIFENGPINVRKTKGGNRFLIELLTNPYLSSKDRGWTLSSVSFDQFKRGLIVSVSSPAFQVVSVVAGHRYLNDVTAVCASQPSQGRLQVNWLDSKSNFISTDIRVFDCNSHEVTHAMEVVAPRKASNAVVYATSHTEVPIKITKISFKK